jgi:hypothetical protein
MPKKTKSVIEDRTDVSQIEIGDRFSETQYYQCINRDRDRIQVRNERGYEFWISSDIVREGLFSADQFTDEQKMTRTELVEILEGAKDTIFTVNFHKQIKTADVSKRIKQKAGQKILSSKSAALAKDLLAGEERTLIGYLVDVEPKMGRSQVIDLEATGDHRLRLVDHRTLNWIIIRNVKYVLKK